MADPEATAGRDAATETPLSPCGQWAVEAGPFVLGALGHEERTRYQAHLSGCRRCRGEVARLAGTRALLARLGKQAWAEAATQATRQPPPGSRRHPPAVRTSHRHAAMLSAAVVLAAGSLAVAPVLAARPEREHAIVAVMRPVARPAPLYALLTLEPIANGSRISLLCGWSGGVAHTRWRLLLTVATADHLSLPVAEWTATGDAVQPVSTWTELEPSRIARVDVSTAASAPLLTFQPGLQPGLQPQPAR